MVLIDYLKMSIFIKKIQLQLCTHLLSHLSELLARSDGNRTLTGFTPSVVTKSRPTQSVKGVSGLILGGGI